MVIFHCLFWPSLTLLGGALIVGMVRLTQYLALVCEKYSSAHRDLGGGSISYMEQQPLKVLNVGRSKGSSKDILNWWPD